MIATIDNGRARRLQTYALRHPLTRAVGVLPSPNMLILPGGMAIGLSANK